MKRVIRKFFFAAAIAIAALSNVEAQNSFPYQAVIRTAKGELVSNQEIAMQFSLIYDGKVVYSETQKPKTNQYGNVQVEVGKGQKVSGSFAEVPWSTMQVMMKIEADPNGGTNYIDLGTIQLQPAPYAMYAPAAGAVSTVQAGDPKSDSNALFEVKDKDGNVVFAVYPDGVRVFVNDTASKAVSTGFAVAGRRAAKEGEDANIFEVNAAGTQVFVNEEDTAGGKAMPTGFAVSGRKAAKDGSDLFTVGSTGTQVYIDPDSYRDATKAISTGFAVSGRKAAKGEEKYLEINAEGTHVYVDDADSDKPIQTGFAVSGRKAAKGEEKILEINAEGTKIYVGSDGKVVPTGFAVSGRKAAKGKEIKLFEVNSYGTQIYIDAQKDKAMQTGFAVSGRKAAKDGTPDKYMVIDADGTVIYVNYEEAKAMQTGFAVSGRKAAKDGTQNTILKVDNTEGTRVYIEDVDCKAMPTGFAVSGRKAAKEGETALMRVTGDNTTIATKSLDMQDKETNKDMMSIAGDNTSIYTDDFSLSNNDDTEMLTANNGGVEVSTELVIAGEVAQTVDVEENEDVDPLVLSAFGMIETVKIADSIPDLDAPKGYSLLKIYGNGKFAQTQNLDAEENTYMLFNAAGNLVANQSDAVAAVILTNASTPDAKLIIWPLKQVNNAPISLGLMAAGDTLNRYVPVNVYVNADGPVECLVDVKSADEELGKVRIEGPKVYGSKVEIHAEPIVEGYHFAGWSDERSANPRTVLILHDTAFADATFAINTYNIKTIAENGEIEISGEQNDDGTFNHGTEVGLNAFASEHYHFMGWTDGEAKAERNFKIVSDTAFEATFAIDSFLIKTITTEGGTVTKDTLCPYGAEIELVATPDEANGYHFVNWNDGNADNPRKLIVENESTFSAYFDKNRYLLTYVVDGEVYDIDTIACDAQIEPIDAPDKVGHNFKGWENMQGVMPKNNLTVIAQYDKESYTITFNTGEGSAIASITADYNTQISEPEPPERTNYNFMGWFTDENYTTPFDFTAPITANAEVYAQWEQNSFTITINNPAVGGYASVSPDANAAGNTYVSETQVTVSANPDVENGYKFEEWTADGMELTKDQVKCPSFVFNIKSDVTLTPAFALMTYHISATADEGGTITTAGLPQDGNIVHGETLTLTATANETYEFTGWESENLLDLTPEQKQSTTIEIVVKQAFDIKATFKQKMAVTFNSNGGTFSDDATEKTIYVSSGSAISSTDIPVPTREGYSFVDWLDSDGKPFNFETKITDNITLTAHWAIVYYVASAANGGDDENDHDGSLNSKFATVQKAFNAILDDGKTNTDYRIVVVGTLEGGQKMRGNDETSNLEGSTITLIGFNELDNGQPIDKIDGGWKYGVDNKLTNTYNADQGAALTIYRVPVPVVIKNLAITGGYYQWGGGVSILAIEDFEDDQIITIGEGTVISGNYALCGSGLCIESESYSYNDQTNEYSYRNVEVTMDGGIITNNEATGDVEYNMGGGGVLVVGGGSKFVMKSGAVKNNSCVGSGGGVYVGEGSVFVMAGGEISGNEAISTSSYVNTANGFGGGVYNAGTMFMYGSAVIGDSSKEQVATADNYSNKSGLDGGGIFSYQGALWIGYKPAENEGGEPIADNDFAGGIYYNYSLANGGGIGMDAYNSSNLNSINKGYIKYNAAANEGGGFGTRNSSVGGGYCNLDITETVISGNKAVTDGGGVYIYSWEADQITMTDVDINGNTAQYGAGTYFTGIVNLHMNGGSISGNTLLKPDGSSDKPLGKGVYLADYNSEMYVSGAPVVDEVYKNNYPVVNIEYEEEKEYYGDGEDDYRLVEIPLDLEPGAVITVTPEEYNSPSVYGDYVSYGTEIIGNCTADNYEYFTVTPNDEHDWVINEEGYLTYECTVEFTGDGTGGISNQTVMLGGKIDNPTDELQEQEGKCFAGWVDNENQFFYPDYSVVTGSMTLTASWVQPFNDIYVNTSSTASEPDGTTEQKAFTTIQDAINLIVGFNQPDEDYTIHVTGMDNNSVTIPEDRCYSVEYYDEDEDEWKIETDTFKIAKSILLQGETGESGLNNTLGIYTSTPVEIKDFKIITDAGIGNAIAVEIGKGANVTFAGTDTDGKGSSKEKKGGVVVYGKLTMNGNSSIHGFKTSNYHSDLGGGLYVDGGELVMNGTSSIHSCTAATKGGAIRLISGSKATMNGQSSIGGDEKGCSAYDGGGVSVEGGSTFIMNEQATITYCTSTRDYGGGVLLDGEGSSFTMNSADNEISYCKSNHGGGVYINGGGTFTMENGKINNNNGSYRSGSDTIYTDGGVCIDAVADYDSYNKKEIELPGKFIMKGGEVCSNTGNGVSVSGAYKNYDVNNQFGYYAYSDQFAVSGVFDMQGGTISGSTNGYGVYVHASAQANSESAHRSTTGLFKIQPQATVTDAVYLEYAQNSYGVSQAQVTIAGALENELMITPKNYNTTLPLVAVAEDAETTFEANLSKFKVSPYMPLGCNMASCYNMGNDGTVCVDVTNTCLSISEMTEDGTIAITGKIADSDQDAWLQSIASAIRDGERKITLDLSDMSEVTKIDESAFENCSNLEGIVLPQGITQIGSSAFRGTSIALIDIPDGVETIAADAFNGCGNLESVVLPASLTTIGTDAFADCSNLKTIYFKGSEDAKDDIQGNTPLMNAQWICNSVCLYVSPNGNGDGNTAAKPRRDMDGSRGNGSIFDKIRREYTNDKNIIVFVDGTMTGTYTLYAMDEKIDNTDVYGFNDKVASITFCGLYGLRNGEPMAVFDGNDMNKDVFTIKTIVPITFKNVKITNGKRGVLASGSGSSNKCNVTLGNGSLVTGNGADASTYYHCGVYLYNADLTLDGGKITANKGKEGAGVYLYYYGKLTMKSGSIEANEAETGGGVYADGATYNDPNSKSTFIMQGGTISGNTATNRGNGVLCLGNFDISGSAYINPNNDVWLSTKINVSGELTADGPVATITPSSYPTSTVRVQVLTTDEQQATLLQQSSSKFAVTNDSQGGRWVIGNDGYLKDGPLGRKSQPGAVGDIVFSDGTAEEYSSNMQLSDKQKNAAVAVIFKVSGADTYGVGLNEEELIWATADSYGVQISSNAEQNLTNYCYSQDDGSFNKSQLQYTDEQNYPAMYWMGSSLSGGYLPAINELATLLSNKNSVNNSLNKLGTNTLSSGYWSSTVSSGTKAYYDSINNETTLPNVKKVRYIKKF